MLNWISRRNFPRRAATALYGRIVAQSRLPQFYAELGVPDDVEGRFELLVLHVFLGLEALRRQKDGEAVSQALVDAFFADLDTSLRELGIGDLAVPKRMRVLAARAYARFDAYRQAAGDSAALALLMERHILKEAGAPGAQPLASYVQHTLLLDRPAAVSVPVLERFEFAPVPERDDAPGGHD
jgi:cytochrome b pre-mRNA-processing protein 3